MVNSEKRFFFRKSEYNKADLTVWVDPRNSPHNLTLKVVFTF